MKDKQLLTCMRRTATPTELSSSVRKAAPRLRWNVSVQMSWRVASKLWDRLAHTHGSAAKVPVLNVDISAAALLVHLDASSLKSLLGLAASMLHFFQYREYRRLRPQVRSCTVLSNVAASQLHSAGVCACALPTCCTSCLWGLG